MAGFEIRCERCGHVRKLTSADISRLLGVGIQERLSTDVVAAVLDRRRRFVCAKCGARSPIVRPIDGPRESDTKICEGCGEPIPAGRLEAVPGAGLCVGCQERSESPPSPDSELGDCPRCGAPLVWRYRRRTPPRGYFIACSGYPECHYTRHA